MGKKQECLHQEDAQERPGFQSGSPPSLIMARFGTRSDSRSASAGVQEFLYERRRRHAGALYFDSVLPLQVHLLQFCFRSVSGGRADAVCGPADRGSCRLPRVGGDTLGAELSQRVDTIYLGGGTPSLLAPALVERLFSAIRSTFDIERDAEITMECAPGQLGEETLAALPAAGVNRVSLGVQSFIDREAQLSGRLHNRAKVEADLRRLRAAGIENLNVDLIAGLAAQSFASWEESLGALVGSGRSARQHLHAGSGRGLAPWPRDALSGNALPAGLVPSDDAIAVDV